MHDRNIEFGVLVEKNVEKGGSKALRIRKQIAFSDQLIRVLLQYGKNFV